MVKQVSTGEPRQIPTNYWLFVSNYQLRLFCKQLGFDKPRTWEYKVLKNDYIPVNLPTLMYTYKQRLSSTLSKKTKFEYIISIIIVPYISLHFQFTMVFILIPDIW